MMGHNQDPKPQESFEQLKLDFTQLIPAFKMVSRHFCIRSEVLENMGLPVTSSQEHKFYILEGVDQNAISTNGSTFDKENPRVLKVFVFFNERLVLFFFFFHFTGIICQISRLLSLLKKFFLTFINLTMSSVLSTFLGLCVLTTVQYR